MVVSEERLMERLRSWERDPNRRGGNDPRRCIASVVEHLRKMLNTRQGNVPIAEDYGVPDFLDFLQGFPDSVRDIEKSIRTVIDKYEPRLGCVSVTFIPYENENLNLRFQISARLATEGNRQVYFETIVDADGKIDVHR